MAKVYLLGAGASASHSRGVMPVTSGMLPTAKRLGILGDPMTRQFFPNLDKYVQQNLGGPLDALEEFDPEYTLSLLDIDIAVSPHPILLQARRELVELIRQTIWRAELKVSPDMGEYGDLVGSLASDDALLTLNWDCLLDRAAGRWAMPLMESPIPESTRYGRFLLDYTGDGDSTIVKAGFPPPQFDVDPGSAHFLKLHGSIDWYRCVNSSCRNFERLFALGTSASEAPTCSACYEKTELTLVPPTLDKKLRSIPVVRRIWNAANHAMSNADELILWGYSAPPTDFFATWLIANAFRSNLRRLTVINSGLVTQDEGGTPSLDEGLLTRVAPKVGQARHSIDARFYLTFKDYRVGRELEEPSFEIARAIAHLKEFYRERARAKPIKVKARVLPSEPAPKNGAPSQAGGNTAA